MSEYVRSFSVSRPIVIYGVAEDENRVQAGAVGENGKTFQLIVNFDNLSLREKATGVFRGVHLVSRLPPNLNNDEGKYSLDLNVVNELEIFMHSLSLSPLQFKKLLQEKEIQIQELEARHAFYKQQLAEFPENFLIELGYEEVVWDENRLVCLKESEGGESGVYFVVMDELSQEEKEMNILVDVEYVVSKDKIVRTECIEKLFFEKIDIPKKLKELEAKISRLKEEIR